MYGALEGSKSWRYLKAMVPGSDPLTSLARITKPSDAEPTAWVKEQVRGFKQDPNHLSKLLGEEPALLIVDQFEEVFTLAREDMERQDLAFVENLLGLTQKSPANHYVIITMRSDYEPSLPLIPALHEVYDNVQIRVTPLNYSELRETIEKPAEAVGLKFERGVVEGLIEDIIGAPTALPLLQFTLLRLWEKRKRNRVTLQAYKDLHGGLRALEHTADEFYKSLPHEEQVAAKLILLRLVQPGEGREVTRNRIRREELYKIELPKERVEEVLEKLVKARLARLTEDYITAEIMVEVPHEALVRNWPTLVEWLEDERVSLRQRKPVTEALERWEGNKRDPYYLLSGPQLDDAQILQRKRRHILSKSEQDFIEASKKAVEEARRKELADAKKLAKQREDWIQVVSTLCIILVFAVVGAIWGWNNSIGKQKALDRANSELKKANLELQEAKAEADKQRDKADLLRLKSMAHSLAHQAISQAEKDKKLSALLALLSYKLSQGQNVSVVDDALIACVDGRSETLGNHREEVLSLAFSPDGKRLVSVGADSSVTLWDLTKKKPDVNKLGEHKGIVQSVAFNPNGKIIASGGKDRSVKLWNSRGQIKSIPSKTEEGHKGDVLAVAFSIQDGQFLASGGADDKIILWDIRDPCETKLITDKLDHKGAVLALAFSPRDEHLLVSGCADGTITVWDIRNTNSPTVLASAEEHEGPVRAITFGLEGRMLASAGEDRTIRLWYLNSVGELKSSEIIEWPNSIPTSIAFSPDGQTLGACSSDNEMRIWEFGRDEKPILVSVRENSGKVLAFSPDKTSLAVAGLGNTIRWASRSEVLARKACEVAARNLRMNEWERYVGPGTEYMRTCLDYHIDSSDIQAGLVEVLADPEKESETTKRLEFILRKDERNPDLEGQDPRKVAEKWADWGRSLKDFESNDDLDKTFELLDRIGSENNQSRMIQEALQTTKQR
jgi:WD40 repeat protein